MASSVRGGGKEDACTINYTKDGFAVQSKNHIGCATGKYSAEVGPSTLASGKAEHRASPECKTIINHAVIQILYERMLELPIRPGGL